MQEATIKESEIASFAREPKKAIRALPYMNVSVTLGLYPNGDTRGEGIYSYFEDGPRDGEEDTFDYEDTTGYYYVMFGDDGCEFEITYDSGTYSGYFYIDGSMFGDINSVADYTGFNNTLVEHGTGITLYFEFAEPSTPTTHTLTATLGILTNSVSFLLNHCTTSTTYPVVVDHGASFTAKFTAMNGYAFKGDNVAEYFSYPQGALNPTYQVTDYIGEFGSYWRSVTITAVVWADCTLTISPAPLDEGALQDAYDHGYSDAKTIYENTSQFDWLKSIWSGMADFFSIEILPNISLGFLAFSPLLVVAIIAVVRIIKHD